MTTALILAKENRVMIDSLVKSVAEIRKDIKDAFNHMSSRLPKWATFTFALLSALVTGLIVGALK